MALVFSPDEKNVFGYLAREFETLDERPLGDVDSLALACASYYRLPPEAASARGAEGMPVTDLLRADWVSGMTAGLWDPEGLSRLLVCMAASPRLRGVRVCHYVEDFDEAAEKQFSACALLLPSGGAYVSFRGTDNTLVGWREDFNMAFETGVPSQRRRDGLSRARRGPGGGPSLRGWALQGRQPRRLRGLHLLGRGRLAARARLLP